jgi:hypothetical protein
MCDFYVCCRRVRELIGDFESRKRKRCLRDDTQASFLLLLLRHVVNASSDSVAVETIQVLLCPPSQENDRNR